MLKVVFAGTPEIAESVLQHILASGFHVDMVLTKPDKPANRGKKLTQSPVKELALANNIAVLQPTSLKTDKEAIDKIRQLQPDIMVVIAYGLILPQEVLDIPRLGCVNIHVSLLPRHRGAAPIQRAILAGDKVTGITVMQMDCGLDTGDILLQREIAIAATDTSHTLHDKLAELGAEMIVEYLHNYTQVTKIKQSNVGVSYADKIEKSEAQIYWSHDATTIERQIRAFNPAPGAFSFLDNELIKIWQASIVPSANHENKPGTIIAADKNVLIVACGANTALKITELQQSGKKRVLVRDFLNGVQNITLVGKKFHA